VGRPVSTNTSVALLALLLLANPLLGQEPVIHARCIGIHDGDTITVLVEGSQQLKIRLGFIDAPELGQAFGQRAKHAMTELVFGKDVELRVYGLDKYGRTLATVFVDGKDVCLEEVRRGYAWVYQRYIGQAPADILASYQQAEIEARAQRCGLWQQQNPVPVPPWEWRHSESMPIPPL
jgi:endonuclease YncB( thermonuclease family)